MNRTFAFATMTVAVILSFSACQKENGDIKDNTGENTEGICQECGNDPCVCADDYSAPIVVDGQFSDWESIDISKMAVAECAENANWTALSTLKVYADSYFMYVYFEFIEDEILDTSSVPFHFYFDADNSAETGGFGDQWTEPTSEWSLEGYVISGGSFCSYDPSLYPWTFEVGENGWGWEESILSGGIASGAGSGNRYELAIDMQLLSDMEVIFADTFGVGVDIQQEWESVGVLPNENPTDDNLSGLAPLLKVTIVQ